MGKIVVKDNQEPLVDIRKYCSDIIVRLGKKRDDIEKTAYLRLSVVKMLAKARRDLPDGYNFIINDAWRPAYVQASIYYNFLEWFKKKHPNRTLKQIKKEVGIYVALWYGPWVSGHMTGGAVDLRIVDKQGHKIPMRSKDLTYQENAKTIQPKLAPYLRKNRELLCSAMSQAGFSNHKGEFWHWSYGDSHWAKREGKTTAIYGPVNPSGKKDPYSQMPCPCCNILSDICQK